MKTIAARSILICCLLFALVACGGGGGGDNAGGGGAGSSAVRLKLSTSAVVTSAPVTSGVRPTSSITVMLENAGDANYYIRWRYSNNGIANVSSTRDRGVLEVLLYFKTPYDLRPATYDDQLIFDLCTDGTCSSLVAGASITVPVQYGVLAPAAGQAPSVALSVTALNLEALITDDIAPGVPDIVLTFGGLQATPFVTLAGNGSAVDHPLYAPSTSDGLAGGKLYADVQSPGRLGPGIYDGTVTITACLDRNCVNPIAGSPVTLFVHLSVANQVDGPNGYRIRSVDGSTADIAWDATRQRLYLSTPDPSPTGTDQRISIVDAARASVVSSIPVAWNPSVMAISDDDQFLYVSSVSSPLTVRRLRASDLSIDATIPTGMSPTGMEYFAREISVAPHQPLTIAVARATNLDTPAIGGLVLIDNVTPRPAVLAERPEGASGPTMDRITWGANSSRLFVGDVSAPTHELYALTADAAGAHIEQHVVAASLRRRPQFNAGLIYTDGGELFDPTTLARIGALIVPPADAFIDVTTIDASGNRAFVMWNRLDPANNGGKFSRYLTSFDLASRTQIATIPLHPDWHPVKIIRWGTNGLALLAIRPYDSVVILIDGKFVTP